MVNKRRAVLLVLCAAAAALVARPVAGRPNGSQAPGDSPPDSDTNDNNKERRSVSSSPESIRQQLRQALSKCNSREAPPTRKVMLGERSAVCNDGTPAGYFVRKSYGSKRWVVFLEGGWYCYDKRSCESRWTRSRSFMSSAGWPETRQVSGILSPDPEENPFWWNANHVYVPYCSSDSWSGSAPSSGGASRFSFMGSSILLEVIRDLLPHGVLNASKLLLTGSSAGGIGVMLNLDRIGEFLRAQGSSAELRGVTDSGWFLDNAPFASADCHDPQRCAPVAAVQMGFAMWNAQVPSACRSQYLDQPWRCFFGHHLHRTLKTPLFIFQWLFDEAQMLADNVGPPMSKEQWDYIHAVGDDLRRTFANVSAVFSPSCISHTVLTKRDWQSVRIGEVSLPQALRCWELQPHWSISNHLFPQSNHRHRHHHHTQETTKRAPDQRDPPTAHHHKHSAATPTLPANPLVLLADDPEMPTNLPGSAKPARNLVRSGSQQSADAVVADERNATTAAAAAAEAPTGRTPSRKRDERRKGAGRKNGGGGGGGGKKSGKTGKRSALPDRNNSTASARKISNKTSRTNQERTNKAHNRRNKDKKRKKENSQRNGKRLKRWEVPYDRNYNGQEVCEHRLVDKCTWPQCNRICPKLHNPFTGEEMDFIQLLKSFGLDMTSVANALGIDMHTLNNMDHEVLLHLLTQQTN